MNPLLLETAIHAMNEGVVIQDSEGAIVMANSAAERILGMTIDQMMGRTSMDPSWRAIKEDGCDFPGEEHPAMVALSTGDPKHGVIMGVEGGHASRRWIRINSDPFFGGDSSSPSHVVSTFEDITEARNRARLIEENEARLQQALELGEAASWEIDLEKGVMHASRGLTALLDEAVVKRAMTDFWSLIYEGDRKRVMSAWIGHLNGDPPLQLDHRMVDKFGKVRWARSSARVEKWNDDGSPKKIIGFFKDISENVFRAKKIEESEARLQFALELGNAASWELDYRTNELHFSRKLNDIFHDYSPENAFKNLEDRIHKDDLGAVRAAWFRHLKGVPPMQLDHRVFDQEGNIRWMRAIAKIEERDETGAPVRVVGFLKDITADIEQKQKIAEALDFAERANEMKSIFVANMSHEIRTPMNAILGMTQALLREELNDAQRDRLKIILESGASLTRIIDDVLDLSKVEVGKLEIQNTPFNLRDLISSVEALYSLKADEKALDFRVRISNRSTKKLIGDSTRIRQILGNLISNAIKFTHTGHVQVNVDAAPDEDSELVMLTIEVVDSGIGIPDDQLEAVFEPFVQTDQAARQHLPGTGLGLSISRHLCELMHGSLQLENGDTHGCIAQVTLPLQRVEELDDNVGETAPPSEEDATKKYSGLNILLAEDHPRNQEVVLALLEPFEANVTVAENGVAALNALKDDTFDIVLMDIRMPVLDGMDALKQFRELELSEKRSPTPVVALTANAIEEDVETYKAAGFNACIAKPFTVHELISVISQLV